MGSTMNKSRRASVERKTKIGSIKHNEARADK